MATNQPASSDVPEGYDQAKIEAARVADARNAQAVRDWMDQYVQPVRDWTDQNVRPVLHQLSQTPPESPDTVNARLLRQKAFKMAAAGVNADIRTPEQTNAISHQIYGDQSAPATPGTATPGAATPGTATPVNRALAVANQATPVDHALTVAGQAFPPLQPFNSSLPMFAQPNSGAQYQPMSASSRSWTDMPPPSNYMPWGDSAPAAAAPAGPIHTAPARATAPAAAASTAPAAAAPIAPAQSSPGFFSGLFKDPYAGMSPKQMNEKAQEMLSAGDEYGANVLTQRADNAMTSSDGSFAQGGSVDENHPVVQRAMHLVRSFLLNG